MILSPWSQRTQPTAPHQMSSLRVKVKQQLAEQVRMKGRIPQIMLPHHLDNVPPPRLLYERFLRQHDVLQVFTSDDARFSDLYKISQTVRKKTTLGEDQSTGMFETGLQYNLHVIFLVR